MFFILFFLSQIILIRLIQSIGKIVILDIVVSFMQKLRIVSCSIDMMAEFSIWWIRKIIWEFILIVSFYLTLSYVKCRWNWADRNLIIPKLSVMATINICLGIQIVTRKRHRFISLRLQMILVPRTFLFNKGELLLPFVDRTLKKR